MNHCDQATTESERRKRRQNADNRFVSGTLVPNAKLTLQQCGLSKKLAVKLYEPLFVQRLVDGEGFDNAEDALYDIGAPSTFDWNKLDALMSSHRVLLRFPSRPTRACVQSFQPILIEENAIQIHPIIAQHLGIDFSGQTAIAFLPTSPESQVEAYLLTSPECSLLDQQHGKLGLHVSKDARLGCFRLTYWDSADRSHSSQLDDVPKFGNTLELEMALDAGLIQTSNMVRFRLPAGRRVAYSNSSDRVITTTAGRILFNETLPVGMPFYNETMKENDLKGVTNECLTEFGTMETMRFLERINQLGQSYLTRSGLSLSIHDLRIPGEKEKILAKASDEVEKKAKWFKRELISKHEFDMAKIDIWTQAIETIRNLAAKLHSQSNPSFNLICSSGLVTTKLLSQLCGAIGFVERGLPAQPFCLTRTPPICSNYREGLRAVDYFILTLPHRNSILRKQMKDKVCDRLFRKVSRAMQSVRISVHDCGTTEGVRLSPIYEEESTVVLLRERIVGRVSLERIVNPYYTEVVIVDHNELITRNAAQLIESTDRHFVTVRSPLTCKAPNGVCQLCYGIDPSEQKLVELDSHVGIQSAFALCGEAAVIGDLRLFLFRFGGPHSPLDAQQAVSRREGIVSFDLSACVVNRHGQSVVIEKVCVLRVNDPRGRDLERFELPYAAKLHVQNGEHVHRGKVLAEWKPNCDTIIANRRGVVWLRDIIRKREPDRESSGPLAAVPLVIGKYSSIHSPRLAVIDEHGSLLQAHFLDEDTIVYAKHSAEVLPGDLLAEWRHPQREPEWMQLTPTVEVLEKILEVVKPRQPALLADFDATLTVTRVPHGRELVLVHEESGREVRHLVPDGTNLIHYAEAKVKAGDPLTWGEASPFDVLRILGLSGLQQHLLSQLARVYRRNRIDIAEQHLELVVHQLTRYCRVIDSGDSDWVPGTVIDRLELERFNLDFANGYVRITNSGSTGFAVGEVVRRDEITELTKQAEVHPEFVPAKTTIEEPLALGLSALERLK